MNDINVKIAIIGGGAAGIHAASTFNYFNYSNCIIEKNNFLGGQPTQLYPNKEISDFPGYSNILGKDVIANLYNQLISYNKTEILLNSYIESIIQKDDGGFIIKTNSKQIICEYIVLATGIGAFLPNKLEIDNKIIENEKIEYTVSIDYKKYINKKIIVLGGGDSAIDWANYFKKNNISNNVAIVHRRDEYRAQNKGINELKENNINEFLNYEIISVNDDFIRIKHNVTSKIIRINYDYIIVQYGQKANFMNIDLLNKINKNQLNKIITDQNQRTNIKNIFAIGSCTYFNAKPNTILTACADGMAVAWYIAKNKKEWNE